MKKLVNIRLPVVLACTLAAGILMSYLFFYYSIDLVYAVAAIPVAAVIFILFTVFSKRNAILIAVLFCIIFFAVGAVVCAVKLNAYSISQLIDGASYDITATVCEKGKTEYGEYVVLGNISAGGMKIDGKMIAYLGEKYGEFCDDGYRISFTATTHKYDLFAYGSLNYNAHENVKYSCNIYSGITSSYEFNLFASVRSGIRNTLYENLDKDTASIALAMLTGNTQEMDNGTLAIFRYGGIAHIFAVSGLHIGILYGLILYLGKKLHANKYALFIICTALIFFYAGVCGFTLSSVRAVIMCTITMIARLLFRKYDSLNSLSIAIALILLISPLSLFSVGFQLSVCAVGAILILSKSIMRPFKKLPAKLTTAVGTALSAQAGTMPVMLAHFGYLSGSALLMNILFVPLLSVLFVIVFLGTVISAVLPFTAQFVMPYSALPLEGAVSFFIDIGFENSLISGFGAGAFIPLYFIAIATASDKFNIKTVKRITAFVCTAVLVCAYVLAKTYLPLSGYKIITTAYYGGGEIIIKHGGQTVLIVAEGINPSQTSKKLSYYYVPHIDAVIILGGENCVTAFSTLNVDCERIFVYANYINIQPYGNTEVLYEKTFTVEGINFEFYDGYNLLADFGGVTAGICANDYVPFNICDLLISDCIGEGRYAFHTGFNQRALPYNIYDCGDLVFSVDNGKLYK